jgi:hypothetical protein
MKDLASLIVNDLSLCAFSSSSLPDTLVILFLDMTAAFFLSDWRHDVPAAFKAAQYASCLLRHCRGYCAVSFFKIT